MESAKPRQANRFWLRLPLLWFSFQLLNGNQVWHGPICKFRSIRTEFWPSRIRSSFNRRTPSPIPNGRSTTILLWLLPSLLNRLFNTLENVASLMSGIDWCFDHVTLKRLMSGETRWWIRWMILETCSEQTVIDMRNKCGEELKIPGYWTTSLWPSAKALLGPMDSEPTMLWLSPGKEWRMSALCA